MSINSEAEGIYKSEKKVSKIASIFHSFHIILVLLVFSLLNAIRQSQRQFLAVASKPIMRDLRISDELFGLITGPVFVLVYVISSPIFSRLADLYSRKYILIGLVFSSSVFCSLAGLVTKSWHLMLVRCLFSISIAPYSPIMISILYDISKYQSTSIGIYNTAIFLGYGASFALGFFVDPHTQNWREIFLYLGVPSILVGIVMIFVVYDPEQQSKDEIPLWECVKWILKRTSLWLLFLATGFSAIGIYAPAAWVPTFYDKTFNVSSKELSQWMSWISPLAGISGVVIGGILSDILSRFTRYSNLILCVVSFIFSLPATIAILLVPNKLVSLLSHLPGTFKFGFLFIAPAYSLMISLVPPKMRATTLGIGSFFEGIIGGTGPLIVGILNRWVEIKWSLFITMNLGFVVAVSFGAIMLIFIKRDFIATEEYKE